MRTTATAALLVLLAACAQDSVTGPRQDEGTMTVDASNGWVYVSLSEPVRTVNPADPATSTAWDIAFEATRVMLNGGSAGPGAVVGWCVCQNAGSSDAAIRAMTPEGERADFEAVTLADGPLAGSGWEADGLDPAIAGWYAYDMATHQVSAVPSRVWKVRAAGPDPSYAKLHVTEIADATQASGRVTIEYAVQPGAGEPFGPVETAELDGRAGVVRFAFAAGVVGDEDEWDLMLDGWTLRVNGGVSGDGGAGAVLADEDFGALTDAGDAPAQVYRGDAFGGVFTSHPWYRYNLDGNHTIFPTYDVYLIDTGSGVHKLQIIGYYDTTGAPRRITFRHARLEP